MRRVRRRCPSLATSMSHYPPPRPASVNSDIDTGNLGTAGNPLRVAIIGSGPSGFYAAEALFKSPLTVRVDMLERFPVPFGLVRYGVAADQPNLKRPTMVFGKIAQSPGSTFPWNVTV